MVGEAKVDVTAGDLQEQLHGLTDASRGIDLNRLCATTQMHAAQQSRQPEKVVAVQVGNADLRDALHLLMVDTELGLRVLATVKQYAETIHVDYLPAAMA